MKSKITWVLCFSFFSLILYGACSFIAFNQNPFYWHWILRALFAILEFGIFCLATRCYCEEIAKKGAHKDKKEGLKNGG